MASVNAAENVTAFECCVDVNRWPLHALSIMQGIMTPRAGQNTAGYNSAPATRPGKKTRGKDDEKNRKGRQSPHRGQHHLAAAHDGAQLRQVDAQHADVLLLVPRPRRLVRLRVQHDKGREAAAAGGGGLEGVGQGQPLSRRLAPKALERNGRG